MTKEKFIEIGKEDNELKVFAIPITWETKGNVLVKAHNGEEALECAEEIGISDIPFGFETIIEDTIEIDWDSYYMGSYEKAEG